MEAYASLTSGRVVNLLDHLVRERRAPDVITVDNGSEFTRAALMHVGVNRAGFLGRLAT